MMPAGVIAMPAAGPRTAQGGPVKFTNWWHARLYLIEEIERRWSL